MLTAHTHTSVPLATAVNSARTQLFRKLVVVAEDLDDGVQHPEAHRDLRLDLVDPLLPRRRVRIHALQLRLGNRPAAVSPVSRVPRPGAKEKALTLSSRA